MKFFLKKLVYPYAFLPLYLIFLSFSLTTHVLNANQEALNDANETSVRIDDFNHPKLRVFIHVCTIGHWQQVLERQLNRIKASGLYDVCDSISLGVLGLGDLRPVTDVFPKATVLFQEPNTSFYERPTLLKLHECCVLNPEDTLVLYLHSKGVTHSGDRLANVTDWCMLMEYFLIERWQDCVVALQDHDVCGVNWRTNPVPHFSGNFWWATAKYISRLPGDIGQDYFAPEFWIGLQLPKVRNFHESHIIHYHAPYPESKYIIK